MVMNKDRTIKSNMAREGQEEVFDTISRDCREKGFRGSAGFYMAVVEANEEGVMRLRVNTARMMPVEPWVCTDQVTGEYGTDKLNITPVLSNSNLHSTIFPSMHSLRPRTLNCQLEYVKSKQGS